jgi:hypothetical protein
MDYQMTMGFFLVPASFRPGQRLCGPGDEGVSDDLICDFAFKILPQRRSLFSYFL